MGKTRSIKRGTRNRRIVISLDGYEDKQTYLHATKGKRRMIEITEETYQKIKNELGE